MAFEGVDTLACHHVPNLGSVVKTSGHKLVAVSIKIETHDFSLMPLERK